MYKQYTDLPTVLWSFAMLGMSLSCLLLMNLFLGQWRVFLLSTAIIAGSIGLSVFLVSILYPLAKDVLFPKKKNDSDDEIF
jgi:formate hydrogenlyase subunit 3/multisubunit Na+/H+ antiporter MnhD subunit